MAKKKKRGESLFAYFQKLFEENPHWLELKSNEEAYNRYRADHGMAADAPLEKKIMNAVANKKSQMKKARGEGNGKSGKKRGAGKMVLTGAAASRMHTLEEQIDDCLATALHMDREALGNVIRLLRNARDAVVLKIGSRANGQ